MPLKLSSVLVAQLTRRVVVLATWVAASAVATSVAAQVTSPVLVDRDMTVAAGATVTSAIGETVARAEDAVIPARLFTERGVSRRAANIAYRWLKLAYFDLPQEQWLLVANHEVMGHGGRLRERFHGPIQYEIDAPVPYGPGGGATFFEFDREPTAYELLAVNAAGMEADAVAARLTAERAFATGRMRPRHAMRYLGFELDTLAYVLTTSDEGEEPGHDVADFLLTYNELAQAGGARPLKARTLRREALVSLANPMLAYAAYGVGRYVWNGATDVRIPALSIAGLRYLPMVRYALTPYGTEWSVANHLARRRWSADFQTTVIDVRFGRSVSGTPWGATVDHRDAAAWREWRFDVGAAVWRQPRIDATTREDVPGRLHFGAEVRGRAQRRLTSVWFSSAPLTVVLDLGGKTSGFIPGEPLRAGLVARVGVGLPLF